MNTENTPVLWEPNVGRGGQILSVAAGSFLLYNALFKKWNFNRAIAGSLLIARGATGYCPMNAIFSVDGTKPPRPVVVRSTMSVNKPRSEVYAFWRNLENLPAFMNHLHSVEVVDETQSRWKIKIPGGLGTLGWNSEIILDTPDETIVWKSLPNAILENAGSVRFADAGKFGTEVNIEISYRPPAGHLGAGVARLFTPAFEGLIREDIKNFRRIIETGEIPTIKGQPKGNLKT